MVTWGTVSRIAASLIVLSMPGCGGSDSSNTAPTPPIAATPTPAPTPAPTPTPAAFSVSGRWRSEARSWVFDLEQQGGTLRGVLRGFKGAEFPNLDDPALKIKGTITSAGRVEFQCDAFSFSFDGTVQAGSQRMTGSSSDCANSCRKYGDEMVKL